MSHRPNPLAKLRAGVRAAVNAARVSKTAEEIMPDSPTVDGGLNFSTLGAPLTQSDPAMALQLFHKCDVTAVAVSLDSAFLVSASWDRRIIVWDFKRRVAIRELGGASPLASAFGDGDSHTGVILSVSISPDSKRVASCSRDKSIMVWNVASGARVCHFPPGDATRVGHVGEIMCVAFFHDNVRLVSCSDDRTVRIWDTIAATHVACLEGHKLIVNCVSLATDDGLISSVSNDLAVCVWDTKKSALVHTMLGHTGAITCCQIFRDNTHVISGSDDRTLRVWKLATGREILRLEGHKLIVNSLAVTASGKFCLSVSNDETLRVWDLVAGKEVRQLARQNEATPLCVTLSSDGRHILTGSSDNRIRIWEGAIEAGSSLAAAAPPRTSPLSPTSATTSFGARVASADGFADREVFKPRYSRFPEKHAEGVNSVIVSMDGKYVFSGSKDDTVVIWELKSGRKVTTLRNHTNDVTTLALDVVPDRVGSASRRTHSRHSGGSLHSPAKRYCLASGSWDRTICVYRGRIEDSDPSSMPVWAEESMYKLHDHTGTVMALDMSVAMNILVSGSRDKSVRVWALDRGSLLWQDLRAHTGEVTTVAISRDERFIVSSSDDRIIHLWKVVANTPTKMALECTKSMKGHTLKVRTVAISSTAKWVISGSNDLSVRLWNVDSGREQKCLLEHTGIVTKVLFSHEDDFAVTASDDRFIIVWDLATATVLRKFSGHNLIVTSISMSSNSKFIVSTSNDAEICVWDLGSRVNFDTLDRHLTGLGQHVSVVELSPDAQRIIVGLDNGFVQLWQTRTRTLMFESRTESSAKCAVCLANGVQFATGHEDGALVLWDFITGAIVVRLALPTSVNGLQAFSTDGIIAASGSRLTLCKWNKLTNSYILTHINAHNEVIRGLAVSASGVEVASCSIDDTAKVFDAETGNLIFEMTHPKEVFCVALSPSGIFAATGCKDHFLRVYTVDKDWKRPVGEPPENVRLAVPTELVGMEFPDEAHILVFGQDGLLRVFAQDPQRPNSWEHAFQAFVLQSPNLDRITLTSLSVSRNGAAFAVSWDDTVHVAPLDDFLGCIAGTHSIPTYLLFNLLRREFNITLAATVGAESSNEAELQASRRLIERNGVSFLFQNDALFAKLANDPDLFLFALKRLFSLPLPVNPIRFGTLLFLAIASRSVGNVRAVLDQLLVSMHAYNQFMSHEAASSPWMLNNFDKDIEMCAALIKVGELFPVVLLDFLLAAPLLCADPAVCDLFSNQVIFDSNNMFVLGTPSFGPPRTWHDLFSTRLFGLGQLLGTARYTEYTSAEAADAPDGRDYDAVSVNSIDVAALTVADLALEQAQNSAMKRCDAMILPFPYMASSKEIYASVFRARDTLKLLFVHIDGDRPEIFDVKTSFLDCLTSTFNADFFDNVYAQSILQHKWQKFGKFGMFWNMAWFFIGLIFLLFLSLALSNEQVEYDYHNQSSVSGHPNYNLQEKFRATDLTSIEIAIVVFYVLFSGHAAMDLWRELRVVWGLRHKLLYFSDTWNYLVMADIIMSVSFTIAYIIDYSYYRSFLSVAAYVRWFRILSYMTPFDNTGPLVRMLLAILYDIRWFLLTLGIAIISTTHAIYILESESINTTPPLTFFDYYNTLMFASFDSNKIGGGRNDLLIKVIFFFSMICVPVVLLNLLIAVMGASYERINSRAGMELLFLRAKVIRLQENAFKSHHLRDELLFPPFLQVLVPEGMRTTSITAYQPKWASKLRADIVKRDGIIQEQLASLHSDRHHKAPTLQHQQTQ